MVKVGLLSVSPLPRIFMVGHNRLSFLPSSDCLIEYTSSAYSTRLSAAGSHMPCASLAGLTATLLSICHLPSLNFILPT